MAMMSNNYTQVSLLYSKIESPGIMSFWFAKPDGFDFQAGQYVKIFIKENQDPRDRISCRSMSIASSPQEPWLQFSMSLSDSEFKKYMESLKPGDSIWISEPAGPFVLPENQESEVYCIAGGIGVTPFRSMFVDLVERDRVRLQRVKFYHVAKELFLFDRELCELPIEQERVPFALMAEKLEEKKIELVESRAYLYISGSPRFVVGVRRILQLMGVSNERIILDSFAGYKEEI